MSLEADQVILLGFLRKGFFQFFRRQAERNVHQRTGFGLGMSTIETAALINRVVDQSCFNTVDLFNGGESALSLGPLEDKSHHVDGKAWRSVVQ